jgi:hypothetical protein
VFGRRLLVLLVVLAVIGVPAGVLRATCAGNSCRNSGADQARVPFCPLPDRLKSEIAAGYREGRSADVLAVTRTTAVAGGTDANDASAPWIARGDASSTGVPIVFSGRGVGEPSASMDGTQLDQIAPTISDVIGFERTFPNVRAGTAVPELADGDHPRLVLEVALKGVGTPEVRDDRASWPYLDSLISHGAGTMNGSTGSLPLDPAATLTTIGTGGLPSQHGITGTLVRNNAGQVVRAWGKGAPLSVIATLPDDLDEAMGQRPVIGLVQTDDADRGLIGGTWYPKHDQDLVATADDGDVVDVAEQLLANGFGADPVPDILAVVLSGSHRSMDRALRRIVAAAERVSGGSLLTVVAGTGSATGSDGGATTSSGVVSQVEDAVAGDADIVAGAVPSGLFLDQDALAAAGVTGQAAVDALMRVTGPDGQTLVADAFQGFAVSFARYC